MNDSVALIDLFSGVATSRDSSGATITASWVGALPHEYYQVRDPIILLVWG